MSRKCTASYAWVIEEWSKIYEEDGERLPEPTVGRDHSAKLVAHAGKELHRRLAIRASRSGRSLNSYCVDVLRERPADNKANKPSLTSRSARR